jgi:periplasmic copper chaperone A
MRIWSGRRDRRPAAVLAGCALAACALAVSGCATEASAGQAPIQATTAYVPLPISPGTTAAYLAIRNYTHSPDRLISARTSVGGRVSFRAPDGGSSGQMHTVGSIAIPPESVLRLVPDGPHLLITGAGPMQNGKAITLTLVFSHGGALSVTAVVTNPQDTQGSNYSMN